MRRSAALPAMLLLSCGGCGYVGPVVPPSPKIPLPVSDLAVIERGDTLDVTFTPPVRTTDLFEIKQFSGFDLAVNDKHYEVPVSDKAVEFKISVADWLGKDVAVSIRTAIKTDKNYSAASNVIRLTVIPPLHTPVVSQEATAEGYRLTWQDEGPGVQYDVRRKGPADTKFVQIGTADVAHYIDGSALWSTPYLYQVQARTATAESPASAPITANHADEFPPAVPGGLAVVATPDAVELSWTRDREPDLKGYYVYRALGDGKFAQTGDITVLPAFTDRGVEHGKTYQYQVLAIDQTGNRSAPSAAVSVTFP